MGKKLKRLENLFGGKDPEVSLFEKKLSSMSAGTRERRLNELCSLAFGYYEELPRKYRKFVYLYLRYNRACYVNYLVSHSILGKFRYTLHNPALLLPVLHVLENADRRGRISYSHLASLLLLIFDYPYKLSTLRQYLSRIPEAELLQDFLELVAQIRIQGEEKGKKR